MKQCVICGDDTEQELCEQCQKDPLVVLLLLWYLIVHAEEVSTEIQRVNAAYHEMLDILLGRKP